MTTWDRIRWWLISRLMPKPHLTHSCANRKSFEYASGPIVMTVAFRDTRREDGYSREELMTMLATVRTHEALQGWKVPESTESGWKGLTFEELEVACKNVGVDLDCGQCASVFFTGHGTYEHDVGCPVRLPAIWAEITRKGVVVNTHDEPFNPRDDNAVVLYRAVTSRPLRELLMENPHGE